MEEPYLGEIRSFPFNFTPKGWAQCNGQLLSINQNQELFAILGTTYGGGGRSNFALPNLMGSAPMSQGTGPSLTPRSVGEAVGVVVVTLDMSSMPSHTHFAQASIGNGNMGDPTGTIFAEAPSPSRFDPQPAMYSPVPNATMNPQALTIVGGNLPHNNMQPYLGLNFIIALQGIFPDRE